MQYCRLLSNARDSRNTVRGAAGNLFHLHPFLGMDSVFGLDYLVTWVDFFIAQRLEPLLGKAYFEGLIEEDFLKKFRAIYPRLHEFFPKERPSLLHGDLWSGNVMADSHGFPALIDPAVYFGNREMDIAFSRMFGGFDQRFYDAYDAVFPLSDGFEERKDVYNLYPLLVHLLLFGKSYISGIQKVISKLI